MTCWFLQHLQQQCFSPSVRILSQDDSKPGEDSRVPTMGGCTGEVSAQANTCSLGEVNAASSIHPLSKALVSLKYQEIFLVLFSILM